MTWLGFSVAAESRTVQLSAYVPPSLAELVEQVCRINQETRSSYLLRLIRADLARQGWVEQPAIQWDAPLFKAS